VFRASVYALRLKAGARYVIRRDLLSDSSGQGRMSLSAREEEPSGAATDLFPAQSAADLQACKNWEQTTRDRP
jgi:hypothetical protein